MGNSTQTASTTAENDHSLFDSSANGGQTRIIHLDVQGMTCASCVGRVERKLRKIPGVDPAVNLPLESARVIVPADITDEQIIETVNNAGYTASLKTEVRDAAPEESDQRAQWGLGVAHRCGVIAGCADFLDFDVPHVPVPALGLGACAYHAAGCGL